MTCFRCPLLLDMDVVSFAKHFLHLELPVCALGCLLLVSQSTVRHKHIAALLCEVSKQDVLHQMAEWIDAGRVVPMAEQVG